MDTVEMVGSTCKTILTSLIEIVAEVLVSLGSTLRGFDHHKADGTLVNTAVILQLAPVDASLMMGDIYAMDLITRRIIDTAIEGTPAEAEGTDEEIIEKPHVADDDSRTTDPPSPIRYTPQQTHKDIWLTTASRTVVSVGRSDPLSANLTALYQLKYEVKRKLKRSYREWKGHMSF